MTATDFEIAFPPPKNFQPLPDRGLMVAAGFDFNLLRRSGPGAPAGDSALIGGLGRLLTWPDSFLAGPVLGAPMAVMALETLLRRGAREIIFVGLAGSLSPEFQPGDLLCPAEGISTEGCSAHYPAPMRPDEAWRDSFLRLAGDRVRSAPIWSTDGIYRETASLVEDQKKKGALLVDMECTALWAAAAFRGVRLFSLLVVSDVLEGLEHHSGFHLPQFKDGLKEAAELAWRALAEI